MKIGVIQASSQRDKNGLLYRLAAGAAAGGGEAVNFGCFPEERETYSYVDIALEISLLRKSCSAGPSGPAIRRGTRRESSGARSV